LGASILYEYGKVRAEKGTQAAVNALGVIEQFGGMVALGIGAPGHHEHILGAKLDTETASLAALLNDLNHAARNLDTIPIQGLSPIAQGFLLGPVPAFSVPDEARAESRSPALKPAWRRDPSIAG
jgi:hypothetical protein